MSEKEKRTAPQFSVDDEEQNVKRTEKKRKIKKRKKTGKPNKIVYVISVLIMIGVIYHSVKLAMLLASYTFLPEKYIRIGIIALAAVNIFFSIYAFLPVNNLNKILQSILCTALAAALAIANNIIPEYKGKLERAFVEVPTEGEMNINFYVLNDSDIETVTDLAGRTIAIQTTLDSEYQEYALKVINHELNGEEVIKVEKEDIYSEMESLYSGEVDAIMLNESYIQILEDNEDFKTMRSDTRLVYTCTQKINLEYNAAEIDNITTEPFIIMVGGNDEWGYDEVLSDGGRTDVNLLVVVNPVTKQVLMISIPRDSYLGLWGNSNCKDKLTHATWFGIDCWEDTINTAFDVDIDCYIRVGFSSIINIVDALGGIDLYNEYEFDTTAVMEYDAATGQVIQTGWTFPEGENHLDGLRALAYCRERYQVEGGDLGRNKHQAQVFKALINKVTSVEGITHISELLDAVNGTFKTDITLDQIYALAQMQLDDMANWSLVQYSVTGSTGMAHSYVWGGDLSMVFLSEGSIAQAKTYISQIMNNETVTIN